jgi:hypothetical protein
MGTRKWEGVKLGECDPAARGVGCGDAAARREGEGREVVAAVGEGVGNFGEGGELEDFETE